MPSIANFIPHQCKTTATGKTIFLIDARDIKKLCQISEDTPLYERFRKLCFFFDFTSLPKNKVSEEIYQQYLQNALASMRFVDAMQEKLADAKDPEVTFYVYVRLMLNRYSNPLIIAFILDHLNFNTIRIDYRAINELKKVYEDFRAVCLSWDFKVDGGISDYTKKLEYLCGFSSQRVVRVPVKKALSTKSDLLYVLKIQITFTGVVKDVYPDFNSHITMECSTGIVDGGDGENIEYPIVGVFAMIEDYANYRTDSCFPVPLEKHIVSHDFDVIESYLYAKSELLMGEEDYRYVFENIGVGTDAFTGTCYVGYREWLENHVDIQDYDEVKNGQTRKIYIHKRGDRNDQ